MNDSTNCEHIGDRSVKRVGFLTRGPATKGSSRTRVLQYIPFFSDRGLRVRIVSRPQDYGIKGKVLYSIQAARMAVWADVVVLQKPNQSPLLIDLVRRLNAKLVVDFDDAVWAVPPSKVGRVDPRVAEEFQRRLLYAAQRAGYVVAGSSYLGNWIQQVNSELEVTVVPTSVDMVRYDRVKEHRNGPEPIRLGWIGSDQNLHDLRPILPTISRLTDAGRARFTVIAGSRPDFPFDIDFEPWTAETEVNSLLDVDIGLMPLFEDERSMGRCGFKALQFMALGIPVVASPVGAGAEVVVNERTGFHARGSEKWAERLRDLIESPALRVRLGRAARRRVQEKYSVQVNAERLLAVLQKRFEAGPSMGASGR